MRYGAVGNGVSTSLVSGLTREGMNYWLVTLGGSIVVLTLREVYRDLFHPTASGSLSDFVARSTFKPLRHLPGFLSDAGPISIILVILIWSMAVALGFALIYWAMPPDYYRVQSGSRSGFWDMLYFSFEVLTTLGLGDYAALPAWLRLLVTFQALVGFAVLTASITSIVLVHQTLARMRTLARKLSIVKRAKRECGVSFRAGAEDILTEFSAEMVRTRVDLIHFPLVYYFYAENEDSALPHSLKIAVALANEGLSSEDFGTRRAAALLMMALRDLAETLRARFISVERSDCESVFDAYAERHAPAR